MATLQTLSILVGVGGLGFGIYQYYQSRKSKSREKNLNQLAGELNELRENISVIVETFEAPTSKIDLSHQINSCAKDVLAYKHETGKNALVQTVTSPEERNIGSSEQAREFYKTEDGYPRIMLSLETEYTGYDSYYDSDLVYGITDHSFKINKIYELLANIQKNHKGILEEFAPGLYQDIEDDVDEFIESSYSQALKNSDGVEINPDDYTNLQDLSSSLFKKIWYYDGIEDDLEKLSELSDEIEDKRITILQASYS